MASVASQLIEEVTAHALNDSLEDAQTVLTFRITYIHIYIYICVCVCVCVCVCIERNAHTASLLLCDSF